MAMKPAAPPGAPHRRERRRGRLGSRLALIVFALVIAVMILRHEVPQIDAWFESILHPSEHLARESCITAALHGALRPELARVVDRGEVHATQAGYYVEAVMLGEMGEDGAEALFRVSCYTDREGELLRATREPVVARLPETAPPQ
jgi:hypothetical protein